MQPAATPTSHRPVDEARDEAAAPVGERLTWPRAALFVLSVCAVLWLGIGLLVDQLLT